MKDIAPGATISKIFGHNTELTEIPVGDIRYGDLKQILFEFEIDSIRFSPVEERLVTFELVYQSQEQDKATPFLPTSGIANILSVNFTEHDDVVENQSKNYEVEVTFSLLLSPSSPYYLVLLTKNNYR